MGTPKPCEKCGQPSTDGRLRRGYCKRCDARRRNMVGYQSSYVDPTPARCHLAELRKAGMSIRQVARICGLQRSVVQTLARGYSAKGPQRRITENTEKAILAVPIPDPVDNPLYRMSAAGALVDATGTIRRLQALVAWGYPRYYLGRRMGWGDNAGASGNISKLMDATRTTHVTAATALKVDSLFRELQLVPGPSTRARNEGAAKGWLLPMDWDEDLLDRVDIDDYGYIENDVLEPDTGKVPFPELYVEMADELAMTDAEIARKLGIKPESLERQKYRYAKRIELERTYSEGIAS